MVSINFNDPAFHILLFTDCDSCHLILTLPYRNNNQRYIPISQFTEWVVTLLESAFVPLLSQ